MSTTQLSPYQKTTAFLMVLTIAILALVVIIAGILQKQNMIAITTEVIFFTCITFFVLFALLAYRGFKESKGRDDLTPACSISAVFAVLFFVLAMNALT